MITGTRVLRSRPVRKTDRQSSPHVQNAFEVKNATSIVPVPHGMGGEAVGSKIYPLAAKLCPPTASPLRPSPTATVRAAFVGCIAWNLIERNGARSYPYSTCLLDYMGDYAGKSAPASVERASSGSSSPELGAKA